MSIIQPTYEDYKESANVLRDWFSEHDLEYVVYGSFNNPKKVRPGLSDLDVFAYKDHPQMLFPIRIREQFACVREKIEQLGIVIQPSFITSKQFLCPIFGESAPYLGEVRRGLTSAYKSANIEAILSQSAPMDLLDDQHMMRYFQRKLKDMGDYLHKIEVVLEKNPEDIDYYDQRALWTLWDSFKKMISLIATSLRIKTGKSLFSLSDKDLISEFQQVFPHSNDYTKYIRILEQIRDIGGWYDFLGDAQNREILRDFYEDVFNASTEAISVSGLARNG